MKKMWIKAGLVAGCIVFVWNTFSWCVLSWHQQGIKHFVHEQDFSCAVRQHVPESGVYFYPDNREQMRDGPIVFASICKEGADSAVMPMVAALISYLFLGCVGSYLLAQTKGLKYGKKVGFFVLLGVFAAFGTPLCNMIWWKFSFAFTLPCMLDLIIAWGLSGLAVGKIIKH